MMSQIQQIIKDTIIRNKEGIEKIQWAVMNSVGSLVYAEYLKNIQKKEYPRQHILVPRIKAVEEFLDISGEFINGLSDNLVDGIVNNSWMKNINIIDHSELKLFENDSVEILKSIMDVYILKNVSRRIPETISMKFQLMTPSVRGTIDESYEIDIFKSGIQYAYYDYVIEETCVQLMSSLSSLSSIPKDVSLYKDPSSINLSNDMILMTEHPSGICPIYFTRSILSNDPVMNIMGFVTGVSVDNVSEDALIINSNISMNTIFEFNFT